MLVVAVEEAILENGRVLMLGVEVDLRKEFELDDEVPVPVRVESEFAIDEELLNQGVELDAL